MEAAYTAHIVTVVGEFVTCEAVLRRVWKCNGYIWKLMKILALPPIRTTSSRKEEAAVFVSCGVSACEAGVFADVAARLRLGLTINVV